VVVRGVLFVVQPGSVLYFLIRIANAFIGAGQHRQYQQVQGKECSKEFHISGHKL
jgi:hypothetical protein